MICLVGFYGTSTLVDILIPNTIYTYILEYMIWLGLVLWYINPFVLFNAKSSLYIYIKYIGFGLVRFNSISIIACCLMPNPYLYIYIKKI